MTQISSNNGENHEDPRHTKVTKKIRCGFLTAFGSWSCFENIDFFFVIFVIFVIFVAFVAFVVPAVVSS